jgi:hypothetical protein
MTTDLNHYKKNLRNFPQLTCKNFKEAGGDTPSLLGYSQPSLNAQ